MGVLIPSCTKSRNGTPVSAITAAATKNKRNMPEKMEIMKFDPVVRKHVAYKETKIK